MLLSHCRVVAWWYSCIRCLCHSVWLMLWSIIVFGFAISRCCGALKYFCVRCCCHPVGLVLVNIFVSFEVAVILFNWGLSLMLSRHCLISTLKYYCDGCCCYPAGLIHLTMFVFDYAATLLDWCIEVFLCSMLLLDWCLLVFLCSFLLYIPSICGALRYLCVRCFCILLYWCLAELFYDLSDI